MLYTLIIIGATVTLIGVCVFLFTALDRWARCLDPQQKDTDHE
jgi:hypothetical protein